MDTAATASTPARLSSVIAPSTQHRRAGSSRQPGFDSSSSLCPRRRSSSERLECLIDLGVPGKEDEHRAGHAHEWIEGGGGEGGGGEGGAVRAEEAWAEARAAPARAAEARAAARMVTTIASWVVARAAARVAAKVAVATVVVMVAVVTVTVGMAAARRRLW